VDHRADVYAMGIIIYEMVTGQVPFDAETPFAIVMKHISEPLPLPRSVKPDLPEGVERVILKALAKDPADRYRSMRDLVMAFDQAVGAAPAEAPPTAVMPGSAPAPVGQRRVAPKSLCLLAAAGLALLMLVLAGVILSQVLGRVGSSGGQVQVMLPAVTATPATELVFPATPMEAETATPAVSTAFTQPQPAPTATVPPTLSATDTPEPTPTLSPPVSIVTPVPLSESAISPENAEQVTQLHLLESDPVKQIVWSPDGKLLAIATYHIQLYDAQTLKQSYVIDSVQWVYSIAFSPDGTLLAAPSGDGVKLWDTTGWGELRTFAGSGGTKDLAFSPDGATLATATGGTVKLWEVASGKELRTIPADSTVNTVAFSPDGRTVASGGLADVRLWDVASGNELYTLKGHSNWINSVAFSPDGQTLASGSVDSTVRLWDVASGRQLRAFTGHTKEVTSVAFSPDGRLLASASWDLTVKLWDVTSGKELRTLTGHTGWVESVAFSPDGATLASGSETVRLWGVAP
jgi:sugar lactone lactonase YvrE